MTRIRGGVAALAVGLLLAGCGPDDSAPAAGGGSSAGTAGATSQADGGGATSQADDGAGQGKPGGGGRWCDAVKAFTDSTDPLFGQGGGGTKADADRARARLKDLKAAAPAEIRTQVMTVSEFYAAVIDAAGKSMAEDPSAYARIGSTAGKLKTAMPPVSDYTVKNCPGLDKQLPVEAS
ncbi:hypothetical protein ABZ570_25225 [Micromonospora sp. NPDC007271]|uniref:hypothetical protein n=1 Tax=Micromonospora sp. NPDC007271 TaxID=3154587 RepID=UPI0034035102